MKKILVIHTSSGYGHLKIAENITNVLRKEHQVDLLNIFHAQDGVLTRWGQPIYLWMLKFIPGLWNFFYTNETFINSTLKYRVRVASKNSENIKKVLSEGNYDAVISTQVTASSVLSYLKSQGEMAAKFVVAFSDFHLHKFWLFDNVDQYLANVSSQKDEMIALGIPEDKIAVTGITLPKPEELNILEMKQKYGVAPDQKVVLVMGGGRGLGIEHETVSELLPLNAKIIVVCGKNEELQRSLQNRFKENNLVVLGFIENMAELYSIANIVVTKPGGLTVAECLQRYIPMYVATYLPGQEKYNYDFLEEKGLIMEEGITMLGTLEDELKTENFKKDLMKNQNVKEIVQDGSKILALV